jgi:hypothetical protein
MGLFLASAQWIFSEKNLFCVGKVERFQGVGVRLTEETNQYINQRTILEAYK